METLEMVEAYEMTYADTHVFDCEVCGLETDVADLKNGKCWECTE